MDPGHPFSQIIYHPDKYKTQVKCLKLLTYNWEEMFTTTNAMVRVCPFPYVTIRRGSRLRDEAILL
jgi:hypothetical protein